VGWEVESGSVWRRPMFCRNNVSKRTWKAAYAGYLTISDIDKANICCMHVGKLSTDCHENKRLLLISPFRMVHKVLLDGTVPSNLIYVMPNLDAFVLLPATAVIVHYICYRTGRGTPSGGRGRMWALLKWRQSSPGESTFSHQILISLFAQGLLKIWTKKMTRL
jgi:hypothetical protein